MFHLYKRLRILPCWIQNPCARIRESTHADHKRKWLDLPEARLSSLPLSEILTWISRVISTSLYIDNRENKKKKPRRIKNARFVRKILSTNSSQCEFLRSYALGERSPIFVSISRSTVETERDVVPKRIIFFFTACTLVRLLGLLGRHAAGGRPPARFLFLFYLVIINTALVRTELKATVVASLSAILPENNNNNKDDDDDNEEEEEARVKDETWLTIPFRPG